MARTGRRPGRSGTREAILAAARLMVARYIVRVEPLASAPAPVVIAAVAPNVQRHLTGDLDPP